MDTFAARGWLDWWANSSTSLCDAEVQVTVTADDGGWSASGNLVSEEDHEGFAMLCELDPVFNLRFEDGSTFSVNVESLDEQGRFVLSELALD